MNKKYVFIIVVLFVASLVIGFVVEKQKQRSGAVINDVLPVIDNPPQPVFPDPETTQQPEYVLKNDNPSFPQLLPAYTVVSYPAASQAEFVAQKLGFDLSTNQVKEIDRYTFIDKGQKSAAISRDPVIFTLNDGSVAYGALSIDHNGLLERASGLINSFNAVSSPISLGVVSVEYFQPTASVLGPAVSQRQATLAQLNFSYFLFDYPLYVDRPTDYPVSIGLTSSGEIKSVRIYFAPVVSKLNNSLPIITYGKAVERLRNNDGVVVRLGAVGGSEEMVDIKPPKQTGINKTDLGYYINPRGVLSAVYVFYGVGENDGNKVSTTTVVSAIE